jgi:PAS domain S-box-containing protein
MEDKEKTRDVLLAEVIELRSRIQDIESASAECGKVIDRLRSFEKTLETMQLGVTIHDLKGNILYVNPADAIMHGYSRDELSGNSVKLYAPPELWKKPLTIEKAKSMKRWKRESINRRKDGSTFPVQLMSDVVTDEDGEPIAVITTCEDISERKKMEAEIKERVNDLENFYRMSIGREVKMKELKEEIRKLQSRIK